MRIFAVPEILEDADCTFRECQGISYSYQEKDRSCLWRLVHRAACIVCGYTPHRKKIRPPVGIPVGRS